MRYLIYDEYVNIGGVLEKTAFERVVVAACAVVDVYTQKRLQAKKEVSENVQCCVRDLCEYLDANNGASRKAITSKSQSAGGVSESESYVTKTSDDTRAEMRDVVCRYLASETDDNGVPLMYRGCAK